VRPVGGEGNSEERTHLPRVMLGLVQRRSLSLRVVGVASSLTRV
jgi:hypothetical protein